MSDLLPELSDRAVALVRSGVILIDIHLSRDGFEHWGRVVQPHPKLGIKTNQTFEVEELVSLLDKIRLPESKGKEIPFRPALTGGVGPHKSVEMSVEEARAIQAEGDLDTVMKGGVKNQLSPDSLTYLDLDRSPKKLMARAVLVSHKIGAAKMTARIAADLDLFQEGRETLPEWWDSATAFQRWKLLTMAKKAGSPPKGKSADTLINRMSYLQCPFRDFEEALPEKDSEGSDQEDWKVFEE